MAHLDDNTRTGLHALGLGLLVIGVPVLIVQVIDLMQTASITTDNSLLHIFRNGYLLPPDGPQLTCDATTRMERIGLSAVAAIPVGLCLGLLAVPFRQLVRPWTTGRWSAFLVFLFLTWCSLTTPVCSTQLLDRGLLITERPTLLGAVALPWGEQQRILNTTGAALTLEPSGTRRTGVFLEQGGTRTLIATTRADRSSVEAAIDRLERAHFQ